MDPNLFHINWERTFEAVVGIIVLAFLVERVTALIVESRLFVSNTRVPESGSEEEKRETQYMSDAQSILRANDDAAKIHKLAEKFTSRHPLWPEAVDGPNYAEEMRDRALTYVRVMAARHARRRSLGRLPIKEAIAFAIAGGVCFYFNFDAWAIILLTEQTSWWGTLLTGAVIAGGSKASIKLFQDLLGVRSMAMQDALAPKNPEKDAAGGGGS